MLNNLLFRLSQYLRDNRARLIKLLLILIAVALGAWLIYYGIERWHKANFEKAVKAKNAEVKAAETKAKDAEAQAAAIQAALELKYSEIQNLTARAKAAEDALKSAKLNLTPLKEVYETTRFVPLPDACISRADACTELAIVNHPCK